VAVRSRVYNRNKKNSVFVPIMIVIAAFLLLFKQTAIGKVDKVKENAKQEKHYETVEVPVPVMGVPIGTKIKDIEVKNLKYLKEDLPFGVLTSLNAVQEAYTTVPLPANVPFFRDNISLSFAYANPVIEQIPQGMRAITLRVDVTSAVEGWASSGSVVDVLLVEKERTSVIAEKVKILSAERVVKQADDTLTPQVPSTVTLLVTQNQALALTTAVPRGKISFALRSKQDEEHWLDKNFTPEKLHGLTKRNEQNAVFKGFVSVKTDNGEKIYALTQEGWIQSDVKPRGFQVSTE